MATLTVELSSDVYSRLHETAHQLGKTPQLVAQEWLVERLSTTPSGTTTDRDRVRHTLRMAGLLVESVPHLQSLDSTTGTLAEIEAAFCRTYAPTLSELVIEQRGENP